MLDGLKHKERTLLEENIELSYEDNSNSTQEELVKKPIKERRSFLDKLTERVKDFLDNAE